MGAGVNKAIKRRNEELERDIASIRKLYVDFTQKSDAFILKLTNERDEANKNLKALINRNWWHRLTRKLEEPKTKGIFNSLNNGNGIQMGKEINI